MLSASVATIGFAARGVLNLDEISELVPLILLALNGLIDDISSASNSSVLLTLDVLTSILRKDGGLEIML
jgi:hypothetical protein